LVVVVGPALGVGTHVSAPVVGLLSGIDLLLVDFTSPILAIPGWRQGHFLPSKSKGWWCDCGSWFGPSPGKNCNYIHPWTLQSSGGTAGGVSAEISGSPPSASVPASSAEGWGGGWGTLSNKGPGSWIAPPAARKAKGSIAYLLKGGVGVSLQNYYTK
jgi:hypothetical protein